jgi:hypothetical protein
MSALAPTLQTFLSEPAGYVDFCPWLADVSGSRGAWFA